MTDVVTKVDENSIKIVKTVTSTQENIYSLGDLVKQKEQIEGQKAAEIAQRDKEIADVDAKIAECTKLGITVE